MSCAVRNVQCSVKGPDDAGCTLTRAPIETAFIFSRRLRVAAAHCHSCHRAGWLLVPLSALRRGRSSGPFGLPGHRRVSRPGPPGELPL
jgi:hypothetical protein